MQDTGLWRRQHAGTTWITFCWTSWMRTSTSSRPRTALITSSSRYVPPDHVPITVRTALSRRHHGLLSHPNVDDSPFKVDEHVLSATYHLDHILVTVGTALSCPHRGTYRHQARPPLLPACLYGLHHILSTVSSHP